MLQAVSNVLSATLTAAAARLRSYAGLVSRGRRGADRLTQRLGSPEQPHRRLRLIRQHCHLLARWLMELDVSALLDLSNQAVSQGGYSCHPLLERLGRLVA
jgi:hypothetical protein